MPQGQFSGRIAKFLDRRPAPSVSGGPSEVSSSLDLKPSAPPTETNRTPKLPPVPPLAPQPAVCDDHASVSTAERIFDAPNPIRPAFGRCAALELPGRHGLCGGREGT